MGSGRTASGASRSLTSSTRSATPTSSAVHPHRGRRRGAKPRPTLERRAGPPGSWLHGPLRVEPVWGGITDHSAVESFSWSPSGPYYAAKVIDVQHQNPGSGWNGDSVQIMFSNATRQDFVGWGGYPQGGLTAPRDVTDPMGVIRYNSTATSPTDTSSRSCRRPPSALATRSVPLQPTPARRVLRRSSSTTWSTSAPLASGR